MADAALRQAQTALNENRLDDAVALAKQAVGVAPRYTRAISGLATALLRAGQGAEARQVLSTASGGLAGSTGDLVEIATFCLREGVQDSAKQILRFALETDPGRSRVAEVLAGIYLAEHDPAAALAVCEPFRARGEATPVLLRLQAVALEQVDDLRAALDCARLYAQVAPLDPRGHFHLGSLEHRLGNIPEAVERYELAVDLDGGHSDITAAATDGLRALDAIQLRQITGLLVSDPVFRVAVTKDVRDALETRGFTLSEEGLAVLSSLDLNLLTREPRTGGYETH
jgi:Flp pilus assembly protein TadD